jgi:outer membrane protein TolC
MIVRRVCLVGCLGWIAVWPVTIAGAQERLSLAQAVAAAVQANPEIAAAEAATHQAEQQIAQARAGWLPRIDFSQSWQRGNQPVFVFGSLLAQRQFGETDFVLRALNDPAPVTNSRSAFSIEQTLFDGGRTRAAVRRASLETATARASARQARNDLDLATTRAYGQVLRDSAERRAAESGVSASEEDTRTAEARRDAGTGTEADVLAMRVHHAALSARAIDAASAERIARADLNRLMNAPFDREWSVEEPTPTAGAAVDVTQLANVAMRLRPEIEQAAVRRDLSRVLRQSARAALLPGLIAHGGYEWNDGIRAGPASSWMAGASLRVSLFAGGSDVARVREASYGQTRAEAEYARAEASVRLEVLTAVELLGAARARQEVGRAAVMHARESHRMIRDRYEAGIAPAADVIRAATAVLDAESQRIGALVDLIVGEATLRRAVGGSEVDP